MPKIRITSGGDLRVFEPFDDPCEEDVELALDVDVVSVELSPAAVELMVEPVACEVVEAFKTIGGKLDCVGIIATVLKSGLEVDVTAVASGPMVTGWLKIAQSSAIAEKVTVQPEHCSSCYIVRKHTLLIRHIARGHCTVIEPFDVHVICTETCPLTRRIVSHLCKEQVGR